MERKKTYAGVSLAVLSYAIVNALIKIPEIIDLVNEDTCFVYDINDDTYEASGRVKKSVASSWFLVEVKTSDGNHLLKVIDENGNCVISRDFITEIHKIDDSFVSLDDHVFYIEKFSNYLNGDEDLEYYTPEDIEHIIKLISVNYNWHIEKILKIAY